MDKLTDYINQNIASTERWMLCNLIYILNLRSWTPNSREEQWLTLDRGGGLEGCWPKDTKFQLGGINSRDLLYNLMTIVNNKNVFVFVSFPLL
jgi:hypothetical protein